MHFTTFIITNVTLTLSLSHPLTLSLSLPLTRVFLHFFSERMSMMELIDMEGDVSDQSCDNNRVISPLLSPRSFILLSLSQQTHWPVLTFTHSYTQTYI